MKNFNNNNNNDHKNLKGFVLVTYCRHPGLCVGGCVGRCGAVPRRGAGPERRRRRKWERSDATPADIPLRDPPPRLGLESLCGGNGPLVWVWGTVPSFLKHLSTETVGFDHLVATCPILSLGVVVFGGDGKRPYGSRGVSKMDPVHFIRGL